jgi:trans-aconitate methyltransferase
MTAIQNLPRLYTELSEWWPILSAPEDYAEEAEFYRSAINTASKSPIKSMLELGCGGGNNASHLKKHFDLTLVDLSHGMLQMSQKLNPECQHIQGDMREVRLKRQFDAVFIHDAIGYMITEDDLRRALETAYIHCRLGGVALFAPDFVKETFRGNSNKGGHDQGNIGMRYLDWMWDPNPDDTTYFADMVYLLRNSKGEINCVHDRHVLGLFGKDKWIDLITAVGFKAQAIPFVHSQVESETTFVFIGQNER